MENNLKILILEDNKTDCELIERELRKGGLSSFVIKRVEDKESFIRGLRDFLPDVVLADYNLPSFNAVLALENMLQISPLVPFIVVTGSVSEEVAVECIKAGAYDYVIKDRLTRLVPAIVKAMDKVKVQTEKEDALLALRQSEQKYRTIFAVSPQIVLMVGRDGTVLDMNRIVQEYVGYAPAELIGKNFMGLNFISGESRALILKNFEKMLKGEKIIPYEVEFSAADGHREIARLHTQALRDDKGDISGALAVLFDITEQRESENTIRRERDRARAYFELAGVMFVVIDKDQNIELINKRGCDILGYGREELLGKNWFEMCVPERMHEEVAGVWKCLMAGEIGLFERIKGVVRTKSGIEKIILWNNSLMRDENGGVIGTLSSGEDISEMERAMAELKKTLSSLKEFKDLTVGRENRMIDLKKEINKLSEELGRAKPYDVSFSE